MKKADIKTQLYPEKQIKSLNPPLRVLLLIVGILSAGLGIIGIFLPLLPTTPFLLLSAVCFSRSSPRFAKWLHTNRYFGKYLSNYQLGLGIPLRIKIITISLLLLTIGISSIYLVEVWWVRVGLVLVFIGVTIHIVKIKTFER